MLADKLSKAWAERLASMAIEPVMRFSREGLILGAGTVLAKSGGGAGHEVSIDPGEPTLRALLTAAYLHEPTVVSLAHLHKAAHRWSEGHKALAAMHLALSGFGRL